jgi:hypothetical protein
MNFASVLSDLVGFLAQNRLRFGLAGALALHAHGHSRATSDLDLVVEDRGKPLLLDHMKDLGYELLHVSDGFSNHLHADPRLGRVDFIYVEDRTADLLFARASPVRLFGDVEVLVPKAEHLAAMKVQAIKDDPSRTLQELADIRFLLQLPGVDREEVRGYFEKHGLGAQFADLLRNA